MWLMHFCRVFIVGIVFVVFSTSIYASAVCVYNLTAIDRVFTGPYKYQVDAQAAWSRVPNPAPSEQVTVCFRSLAPFRQ